MLCNLFLSFYILCSSSPDVPVRLLKPVRAGRVRCLVAGLVGSLVLRTVLAVYVLSVTVLSIAVLTIYVLSVTVLSVAVLITVSAIRRIVLCIRVFCHIFLHSGAKKLPPLYFICLLQDYYLKFGKKYAPSVRQNHRKIFLKNSCQLSLFPLHFDTKCSILCL